ncbi:hypothetical protein [Mycolicibacterium poriferae]|uniref:hypothetical protein n=1 Tax=Mycolicibacterium poriferae TaxID=39694 RepID=UPI00147858AA|nr:hypothetical protein [Mycolicibacterium poriferae]MCV7265858.1 hypothetical protein [Mycolicibacterium poriferae]
MREPSKRSRDAVNNIFGDALPETTRDEREPARPDDENGHDRWLRENVPPHHD